MSDRGSGSLHPNYRDAPAGPYGRGPNPGRDSQPFVSRFSLLPPLAMALQQHPDQHRPQRPILLAVDQGVRRRSGPEPPSDVPTGYKQQARLFAPGSCLTERRSPRLAW
jgi:hypothetical protein